MTTDLSPRETVARAILLATCEGNSTNAEFFEAEGMTPWRVALAQADAALTALADHPGLVEVLAAHRHEYDGDCGIDFGCTCGAIQDYDEADTDHTAHLADVIRAWLRGAS